MTTLCSLVDWADGDANTWQDTIYLEGGVPDWPT